MRGEPHRRLGSEHHPAGTDAFAEVVEALEIVAAGDHELTEVKQDFQGELLGLPGPPAAAGRAVVFEAGRADGALVADALEDGGGKVGVGFEPIEAAAAEAVVVVEHALAITGEIVVRQETGGMGPVFEHAAAGEEVVEPGGVVVAEAAPKDEVGAAGDDVDGVDLEGAHAADGVLDIGGRWAPPTGTAEALRGEQESPDVCLGERHAHAADGYCRLASSGRNIWMRSMGMGKTMVLLFSTAISERVWRSRSWRVMGSRAMTAAASARRSLAWNSPSAAMILARRSR